MKSFFFKLLKILYSGKFYREDALHGKGVGFILVAFIALLMTVFIGFHDPSIAIKRAGPALIEQMPLVTIENGVLKIDKPTPYTAHTIVKNLTTEMDVTITFLGHEVENWDEIEVASQKNPKHIFITLTKVISKNPKDNNLAISDISSYLDDGVFTHEILHEELKKMKNYYNLPATYMIIIASLTIIVIILSLLALGLNFIIKTDLSYTALARFSSYSLWPAFLIGTWLQIIDVSVRDYFSIIPVLYITFALLSVRKTRVT